MENFKINRYENQDSFQNPFEDFQTLSLEHLNEERQSIEENRAEREAARSREILDSREELNKIFERNQESGRENASFFDGRNIEVPQNVVYFEDYGANFETFDGQKGFEYRPNLNLSQAELAENLENSKKEKRIISLSQRVSTLAQSLGLGKAA